MALKAKMKWYFFRVSDEISYLGILNFILGLFLLSFYFLYVDFKTQSASSIENYKIRLIRLQSNINKEESYTNFLEVHPSLLDKASSVQRIFNIAEGHKINLSGVVYKQEGDVEDPLAHLTISFGITESYSKTKAFLNELLTGMPYLTIDNLTYTRAEITNDALNTRVRLSLHFKK